MNQQPRTLDSHPSPTKVEKTVTDREWYAQVYHGLVEFLHRFHATARLTWLMLTECFHIASTLKKWAINSYTTN
jgi:hypothetical protein